MAEPQKTPKTEEKKQDSKKEKTEEKKVAKGRPQEDLKEEVLVRVSNYDLFGSKNIYVGLTRIKGVSWAIANAICLKLGFPRNKKVSDLTKEDVKRIEDFLKSANIPDYMKNRRKDFETGETKHYVGSELDIRKDFDIRRLKKIRSYKGIRHTMGQPVRGQKTRSHFRTKGRTAVGVRKGADKAAAAKPKPSGGKK